MADISLNSAALDQGTFFWGGKIIAFQKDLKSQIE